MRSFGCLAESGVRLSLLPCASESTAPSGLSCPYSPGAPFQRISPRSKSKPQSSLCTKHPPRLFVSVLSAWRGAEGSAQEERLAKNASFRGADCPPAARPTPVLCPGCLAARANHKTSFIIC
uniref:Uncharacterized protein n=1 Tax=Molossus molossus TaxID=27622 RepID=A0A7J8JWK4_MOLMO|nr:hypothetical protein HJG59_008107 [Molossus molossus]